MGFFRQFKASFSSFDSYSDFAAQRTGKTFKYFFLLFTIIFLVWAIPFAYNFNSGAIDLVNTVKAKIPDFRLADGQLEVDAPQPIVLNGENQTALIIDTTGKTDESVLDKYNEGIFVSRDKIVNKQGTQINKINFADMKQLSLDKQELLGYLPLVKWLFVIIAVFGYVFGAAWILITTVILALIGLFINSTQKGHLQFGQTWNVAVYALTLPWVLDTLKGEIYPQIPFFWVIKWGLAIFIMYKGIEAANKHLTTQEPPLPPSDVVI